MKISLTQFICLYNQINKTKLKGFNMGKHNMRVSYSCIANFKRLIKLHNHKILNKSSLIQNQCNCVGGCIYDLKGGNCHSENIIYKATVNSDLRRSSASAYAQFRFRYANHKKSFKGGVYEKKMSF